MYLKWYSRSENFPETEKINSVLAVAVVVIVATVAVVVVVVKSNQNCFRTFWDNVLLVTAEKIIHFLIFITIGTLQIFMTFESNIFFHSLNSFSTSIGVGTAMSAITISTKTMSTEAMSTATMSKNNFYNNNVENNFYNNVANAMSPSTILTEFNIVRIFFNIISTLNYMT